MRHGSLFSGIGGFDLAAEWMGWENVFHCEWNEFGQKILKYYWPNAISYGDITKTDFSIHRGSVDIITGGFPCQPYSLAGKRKGKEDERHLWPEMLRAIREIKPTWVVGENVFGITNWDGGVVFNEVQADLEAEGYEVQPYVLPACAVNAPHRRDRVWFVAYRKGGQSRKQKTRNGRESIERGGKEISSKRNAAHTSNERPQGGQEQGGVGEKGREGQYGPDIAGYLPVGWANFPTQPPLCSRDDGVSFGLDRRTFSKWRNESIKAMGNAIVPQVALQIFKAIEQYEINK